MGRYRMVGCMGVEWGGWMEWWWRVGCVDVEWGVDVEWKAWKLGVGESEMCGYSVVLIIITHHSMHQ